jgi:L-ribulokinase
MSTDAYVIGVDYGTDSVRSIIVNARNGQEVATAVHTYSRWRDGMYCNASLNQFRQHPLDYIEGLEQTIRKCLSDAGDAVRKNIVAISVDTTGSTPVAVDQKGTPLSLTAGFENNPNAMFILWKDHTAVPEAAEINDHARQFEVNYLQYVGGIYSSEWYWAKALHIIRSDADILKACYAWVEHCDWIPFLLTGGADVTQLKRGVCSAGHKALWTRSFGGLPPQNFFTSLDPRLAQFTSIAFNDTFTAAEAAGKLSESWAQRLGLSTNVVVGIGAFDCHMGAVGGQIEPYYLSKVMGTSTCDMMVIPGNEFGDKLIKGICGQVDGSIIPGMIGLEAGQSAFGDTYAWYKNLLMWPLENTLRSSKIIGDTQAEAIINDVQDRLITSLSHEASLLETKVDDELALDWLNGRRTPDANQQVTGSMMGLKLGTSAPTLFKAWVEATCFGAKAIVDRFIDEGIPVKGLIGLGGVARKSPYIMQVMANVMDRPIRIHKSEQTCALGAAMFAATVAGLYPTVEDAMQAMGQGFDIEYRPEVAKTAMYEERYQRYKSLGAFVSKIATEAQSEFLTAR